MINHGGYDHVRVTDNGDGTVTQRWYRYGRLCRVNIEIAPSSPQVRRSLRSLACGDSLTDTHDYQLV